MSRLGLGLGITKGGLIPFNPLSLDPYLFFDSRSSMIGTLENPTLDLNPANPETLDVITATRTGVATYTDADGLIQSASPNTTRVDYTQGAELTPTKFQRVGYTDFSSGWNNLNSTSEAGDGYLGQPSLIVNAPVLNARTTTSVPTETGVSYTASFYVRYVSGSSGLVWMYTQFASDNQFTPITVTSEWTRVQVQFTGGSGSAVTFGVSPKVAGESVEIAMPQVEEGTTASSFVANTTGSPKFIASATYGPRVPMILVEPSATNFITYSEDFSQWTSENATVSLNVIESPAGTQDGCKMIASTSVERQGIHSVQGQSGDLSFSVYAKKGEYDVIQMTDAINGSLYVNFNLTSGTVGSYNGVTPKIENVGNGWFRCSLTWNTVPINKMRLTIARTDDESRLETFAGNGTDGLYLWGAQLETGSVSTSYIPTSGSTVTRAADDLVISGSDFTDFYNQTEFTLYLEAQKRDAGSVYNFTIGNGTLANRIAATHN